MTRIALLWYCLALVGCQASSVRPDRDPKAALQVPSECPEHQATDATAIPADNSETEVPVQARAQMTVDITRMIDIPAGMAVIGSTEAEARRAKELCKSERGATKDHCTRDYTEETPRREVSIPRFWLDEHEVTVGEYRECVDAKHCTSPSDSAIFCDANAYILNLSDHPINCVTWHQAVTYCNWQGKRLPSSDEWEKAARGPSGETFPWGEEPAPCEQAERPYRGRCGDWTAVAIGEEDRTTSPVGSAPVDRSPYGVADLAGNVAEWTASEHGDGVCVVKGATLLSFLDELRGAGFFLMPEEEADAFVGFRCAYSEDETEPEAAQPPQLEVDAL